MRRKMKRAFVFPGQGSQQPGMGRDLAEAFAAARLLFEEVDDALSQHLSRLMFDGPESELTLTENAQPALLAASLAVIRVLQAEAGFDVSQLAYVAGHSLGEYSAHAAAGTFSVPDAARLVKRRGQAMQKAVPVGEGAMAALLGLDIEAAREVAAGTSGYGICVVANDNCPGQIVVSGHAAAVERAVVLAAERGARRSIMLPVSAPFHCPLMAPASGVMNEALSAAKLTAPCVPVVTNVTAKGESDPAILKRLLVDQVTGMVRWRESIQFIKRAGVTRVVEIGAGKVLSGLNKRIAPEMETINMGTPADLEAFARVE